MLWDLPTLLQLVAPERPSNALISEAAWRAFDDIPALIPTALSVGCFECRLEEDESQVDLMVLLSSRGGSGGGRHVLWDHLRSADAESWRAEPRWRDLLPFLHEWSNPEGSICDTSEFVWLEFDMPKTRRSPPVPFSVMRFADPPRAPARAATTRRVAEMMLGKSLDDAAAGILDRCERSLGDLSCFLHVAATNLRGADAVRIVVSLPARDAMRYLASIEWPGDRGSLEEVIQEAAQLAPFASLHLDILPDLSTRVGVDLFRKAYSSHDRGWRRMLTYLECNGACSPEKAEAVLQWLGPDTEAPHWPVMLGKHVGLKIVHQEGQPLRAKAYLAFIPRLVLQ